MVIERYQEFISRGPAMAGVGLGSASTVGRGLAVLCLCRHRSIWRVPVAGGVDEQWAPLTERTVGRLQ